MQNGIYVNYFFFSGIASEEETFISATTYEQKSFTITIHMNDSEPEPNDVKGMQVLTAEGW